MILRKQNTQSARWDKENNKWDLGTEEYQWYSKTENSPWMSLDDALKWIKEHDSQND
jgi:hypothetical protein